MVNGDIIGDINGDIIGMGGELGEGEGLVISSDFK